MNQLGRSICADEAVSKIKSGDRVFVQGSAATPLVLTEALGRRAHELHQVEIVSITTLGEMKLLQVDYPESFYINSLFVSANTREAVNDDRGDYIPIFLSEISTLFAAQYLPLDVALIHVSPPDKHGYCSLGVSVDITKAAVKQARCVIAQINPNMPRTLGDGLIHLSEIHQVVETTQALPEVNYLSHITPEDIQIGKFCASIIEDGATLQMGIGTIPDAVMMELGGHKDLGVHTEMFSDGVINLYKKGIITNKFKKKHRQKIVSTFAIGSRDLYDFIDDNPAFSFLESAYVNDTYVIAKNPKVAAINSAIEIDLTGQVCADSIGTFQFSGVGGQMDFIRGANLSEGGKPIIAMSSMTKNGESKIVPFLKQGAGVVTTRAHVHYVVTEFGYVNLFGKNLKQRAYALIELAHPSHREALDIEAFKRFGPKFF
ncbi:MAG: acetyl-CoA hydrolase/transferase family protein [Chitinophagaceae bacterium]|nr:acetyl-CoA hydrolase/transferase family protein [Chitinophagaceae bacterium]